MCVFVTISENIFLLSLNKLNITENVMVSEFECSNVKRQSIKEENWIWASRSPLLTHMPEKQEEKMWFDWHFLTMRLVVCREAYFRGLYFDYKLQLLFFFKVRRKIDNLESKFNHENLTLYRQVFMAAAAFAVILTEVNIRSLRQGSRKNRLKFRCDLEGQTVKWSRFKRCLKIAMKTQLNFIFFGC